jgi:ParB-like chromosome segregation protein Spo0J
MKTNTYELHPLCSMFPPMDTAGIFELADDIKAHGQREAIVLLDGQILDGRNRYLACQAAKVEPRVEPFTGSDALAYVISRNLRRRHLTESQRSMMAEEILRATNPPAGGLTQAGVAEQLHVSERSVQRAASVASKAAKPVKALVKAGKVSLRAAEAVAKLPKARQRTLAKRGASAIVEAARPIPRGGLAAEAMRAERPALPNPVLPDTTSSAPDSGVEAVVARIEACYEEHRRAWNSPPPPAPRHVVDKIITAVKGG